MGLINRGSGIRAHQLCIPVIRGMQGKRNYTGVGAIKKM